MYSSSAPSNCVSFTTLTDHFKHYGVRMVPLEGCAALWQQHAVRIFADLHVLSSFYHVVFSLLETPPPAVGTGRSIWNISRTFCAVPTSGFLPGSVCSVSRRRFLLRDKHRCHRAVGSPASSRIVAIRSSSCTAAVSTAITGLGVDSGCKHGMINQSRYSRGLRGSPRQS